MSSHTLTLQRIDPVTHDVFRLEFDRPDGFDFTPGQATELALDRDGWRDEGRPFTFTSLPDENRLEFVIKSYPDHNGVTEQIAGLKPGDTVLIGDAWGAIEDKGPGTFIAGGAGITPFIPILRARAREDRLQGCRLIFGNITARDVILKEEWDAMPGLETIHVLAEDKVPFAETGIIDKPFLDGRLKGDKVYICGPPPMVDSVETAVEELGVADNDIVTENA